MWVGNTANGLCCWLDHDSSDRSGMAIAQTEGSLAHSFSPTPSEPSPPQPPCSARRAHSAASGAAPARGRVGGTPAAAAAATA